jgi:hypothetical protein
MYSLRPSSSTQPWDLAMPHAAAAADDFAPRLTDFESAFIRTVLEHRGLLFAPSLAEFSAALEVLRRFDQQCQDNPGDADFWVPAMDAHSVASLRAKAFVMFGATKPTPAQWHKAHAALFGPLLCESCG